MEIRIRVLFETLEQGLASLHESEDPPLRRSSFRSDCWD